MLSRVKEKGGERQNILSAHLQKLRAEQIKRIKDYQGFPLLHEVMPALTSDQRYLATAFTDHSIWRETETRTNILSNAPQMTRRRWPI